MGSRASEPTEQDEQAVSKGPDRRTLIRRGGVALAATVGGLAVAEVAAAGSASAANGDALVLGSATNSAATTTSLTSASSPTLTLATSAGAAPLGLAQQDAFDPANPPAMGSGDLANYGGDLYYGVGSGPSPVDAAVFHEYNANTLVPIVPQRVVDTRSPGGRANIMNATGNLDAQGRLLGFKSITIDLSGLSWYADAAYCNLTAVTPLGTGYLTIYPGGNRPSTSTLNYTAKSVVANFAVTGVSTVRDIDQVTIFSNTTTHVLLDITAFAVGNAAQQVNPTARPSAAPTKTAPSVPERKGSPVWS